MADEPQAGGRSPGWYTNPGHPGMRRWFTGTEWGPIEPDPAATPAWVPASEPAVAAPVPVPTPAPAVISDPISAADAATGVPANASISSTVAGVSTGTALTLAAVLAILVGCIGPWATSPFSSVSGVSGDGKWCALLAIAAGVLAWRGRGRITAMVLAVLILADAIYEVAHINHVASKYTLEGNRLVSVGWGVYLMLVAAVAVIVLQFRERRTAVTQ